MPYFQIRSNSEILGFGLHTFFLFVLLALVWFVFLFFFFWFWFWFCCHTSFTIQPETMPGHPSVLSHLKNITNLVIAPCLNCRFCIPRWISPLAHVSLSFELLLWISSLYLHCRFKPWWGNPALTGIPPSILLTPCPPGDSQCPMDM